MSYQFKEKIQELYISFSQQVRFCEAIPHSYQDKVHFFQILVLQPALYSEADLRKFGDFNGFKCCSIQWFFSCIYNQIFKFLYQVLKNISLIDHQIKLKFSRIMHI